jgi:hypothetical protein
MMKNASPEEKKQIEKELMEWLKKKARSQKKPADLRLLAETVSIALAPGREIRLELAERLMLEPEFFAAEQLLLEVRGQKHDRIRDERSAELVRRGGR